MQTSPPCEANDENLLVFIAEQNVVVIDAVVEWEYT